MQELVCRSFVFHSVLFLCLYLEQSLSYNLVFNLDAE